MCVPKVMNDSTDTAGKVRKQRPSFLEELREFLDSFPNKAVFLLLTGIWFLAFHLFGNSTFGYTDTNSLFGWLDYDYSQKAGDEHGYLVPFAVLALIWYEKKRFIAVHKETWWPALIVVVIGILIHLVGYRVQQVRISIIGFFLGWYGLMGMVWGKEWLRAVFFPYILFIFCFPIGSLADNISVPLRKISSVITATIANIMGIDVVRRGTMLFNHAKGYEYEVAAACSGLRSLIATLGIGVVYGFLIFKTSWRRGLMVVCAVPLAVAANVTRLLMIIFAAEIFGQKGGMYVHDSTLLSLIPYVVAFIGMAVIGRIFTEEPRSKKKVSKTDDEDRDDEPEDSESEKTPENKDGKKEEKENE